MWRKIRVKLGGLSGPEVDAEGAVAGDATKVGITTAMTEFRHIGQNQASNLLLEALSKGAKTGRKPNNIYFQWYLRYLRHRLKGVPKVLLCLITPDIGVRQSPPPEIHPKVLVFLATVAELLKSENQLTLNEILEKLEDQGILLAGVQLKNQAIQLIFIIVGLLTFFYDPVLDPEDGVLQILGPEKARARVSRNDTWVSYSQDMSHVNQPIVTLLRQFGGVKGPIPWTVFKDVDVTSSLKSPLDPLISSNLSYFTLKRVAKIDIEWVGSVCLHLEFNMRRKMLKLFRFPSLCGLLCDKEADDTFLSLFFDDYFADNGGAEGAIAPPSAQFYREVIQSYRLLFGQDKLSWKAFTADYGRKGPLAQANLAGDTGEDTLLPCLCGEEWLKQGIYEDIDASGVKSVYSARADFPFLADRLLSLQQFAVTQCPSDWRTVWRDRRDTARFWTLWAVMVFGGASIVLGIVQVALAVAQVVAAYTSTPKSSEL